MPISMTHKGNDLSTTYNSDGAPDGGRRQALSQAADWLAGRTPKILRPFICFWVGHADDDEHDRLMTRCPRCSQWRMRGYL
jgi:hypothetical protein